ncbi:hypothetical protein ACX1C1_07965 [Paenibacillus sp. strain BS8-2]
MKKVKQPGDNLSLKTKKNEHPLIMDWLNSQTNLMDSLRYLVEREISSHGVRNLQACIPAERNGLAELSLERLDRSAAQPLAAGIYAAPRDVVHLAAIQSVHNGAGQMAAAAEVVETEDIETEAEEMEDMIDAADIEAWS